MPRTRLARTTATWTALSAAILAVLAGGTVLAGWATGRVGLTTLGFAISMKANAAACLVLLGLALLRRALRKDRADPLAAGLAWAAASVGALTLLEHLTGVDLGIDQLLAREAPGAPATAAPGRMGPPGSTSILLLGTSFALARARGPGTRAAVRLMLIAVSAIALLPIVGYAYEARPLYGVARYTGIAFVTACVLEALAVGGLLALPGNGLFSGLAGAALDLARRSLVYLIAVPFAVGWVVVRGLNAGLYDGAFGVAVLVTVLIVSLNILAWRDAVRVARSASERDAAADALGHANRRKDEFLAMLSHELRNPLASIRHSVHVLRRSRAAAGKGGRAEEIIERQAEHLSRLVDDLLDVTRIASGKIELRRRAIDLRDVVRAAAEDGVRVLRERGVDFALAVPPEPVWAEADATRIAQVLGNLLHNAGKFTRRGDRVAVSLAAVGDWAELRVKDTGAGIAAPLLPIVFEPFVQGEPTRSGAEGGLGLGLALVKGIAELHGGNVAVESGGAGKGTEFVVRVPRSTAPAAAPAPPAPGRAAAPRLRLLIVDDNADAAESLAAVVELLGHEAEVAHDGPSALARARAGRPDAVLCDLGLPGMSGYEVARALRAETPAGVRLRLIAISGYARPEDVQAATDAGFDLHLAKPCDPEVIERALAG